MGRAWSLAGEALCYVPGRQRQCLELLAVEGCVLLGQWVLTKLTALYQ